MIKEKKKVLKIVDAFNAYCFFVGGTNVESKIKKEKDKWVFNFKSDFKPKHLKSVKELDQRINSVECGNTEEMYWTILTSEDFKDENDIYLIANMVEESKTIIKGNSFEIEFVRYIKD